MLCSRKKHKLLFRQNNRLIVMTGMTVKGEEASDIAKSVLGVTSSERTGACHTVKLHMIEDTVWCCG